MWVKKLRITFLIFWLFFFFSKGRFLSLACENLWWESRFNSLHGKCSAIRTMLFFEPYFNTLDILELFLFHYSFHGFLTEPINLIGSPRCKVLDISDVVSLICQTTGTTKMDLFRQVILSLCFLSCVDTKRSTILSP